MPYLSRILAAIVLACLTLNAAQAGNPVWCGYNSKLMKGTYARLTDMHQAVLSAMVNCSEKSKSSGQPEVGKNFISAQLFQSLNVCQNAIKTQDVNIEAQCASAYLCLQSPTQVNAGAEKTVCLKPNYSDIKNPSCTIVTDSFYDQNSKTCKSMGGFVSSIVSSAVAATCPPQGKVFDKNTGTCIAPPAALPCPAPQVMNSSINQCVSCSAPLVYSSNGTCVACPSGQVYNSATAACAAPAAAAAPAASHSTQPAPQPAPAAKSSNADDVAAACANTPGTIEGLKAQMGHLSLGGNTTARRDQYNRDSACCVALTGSPTCD